MALPSVGPQVHVTLDIQRQFAAQVTFDFIRLVDHLTKANDFVVAQVVALLRLVHIGFLQDLVSE